MSNNLYVVGGKQRAARPLSAGNQDWNGYEKGLVVELDPLTGATSTRNEYAAPPQECTSADGAVLYQAGSMQDGKLYLCTQTEVIVYALPGFVQLSHISLPCFNDLHHVCPTPEGNLLVANAGLEMVLEVTPRGEICRVWNVLGEDPWQRFSRSLDYRGLSTKPHRAHPNYIFYMDDQVWVTRFHQGDAISLADPSLRIPLSAERIHDGVYYAGYVYFTSVNGRIIVANPRTLRVEETIDLNAMHPAGMLLGWCRSILLDGDKIWVGFSRIRPTKFRENVAFVMRGFKRVLPTHLACYDLKRRRCLAEIDLEPAGLSAIYSIFPVVEGPTRPKNEMIRSPQTRTAP
jgi:hypothetical protein